VQRFYILGFHENQLTLMTRISFQDIGSALAYKSTIHPSYGAFVVQSVELPAPPKTLGDIIGEPLSDKNFI
jgi:hypothetical protein